MKGYILKRVEKYLDILSPNDILQLMMELIIAVVYERGSKKSLSGYRK
jgi:hypothetical protein